MGALDALGLDGAEETLWFPIGAYVSCICLYCSMGSAMFINWERGWSFLHAFHFGFNLIVTVGLGDIVVTNYIFLSFIVAFVIVGKGSIFMFSRLRRLFSENNFVYLTLLFRFVCCDNVRGPCLNSFEGLFHKDSLLRPGQKVFGNEWRVKGNRCFARGNAKEKGRKSKQATKTNKV